MLILPGEAKIEAIGAQKGMIILLRIMQQNLDGRTIETGRSDQTLGNTQSLELLKTGITQHWNGGTVVPPFSVTVKFKADDAGQDVMRAGAGTNTIHTIEVTDSDSESWYLQCVIGNISVPERTAAGYKSETYEILSLTDWTRVE